MAETKALAPGWYVGLFRRTLNFQMDEPKITSAQPVTSFEELFTQYQTGQFGKKNAPKSGTSKGNVLTGKTTSSSGWVPVHNCDQLRQKAIALPTAWKASGGSDPAEADRAVREFKQGAARLLAENVGKTDDEVIQVVRQINQKACTVQEIRVKLLKVAEQEFKGAHQSGDRWFGEVTLRKFYVTQVPTDEMLYGTAEMLVDTTCAINSTGHVVIARADGKADGRAKDRGRFTITSVAWTEKDADIKKILDFLNSRKKE